MAVDKKLQLVAQAVERLKRLKTDTCFEPRNLDSKPHAKQLEIMKDIGKISRQYVIAGNQCLAEGTLVKTLTGIKRIEEVQPGDFVFDEYGKPVRVLKKLYQGKKIVYEIKAHKRLLVEATLDHRFLDANDEVVTVKDFNKTRLKVFAQTHETKNGTSVPTAYAIGAFIGNGVRRKYSTTIAAPDDRVPNHLAKILNTTYSHSTKYYNYIIHKSDTKIPFYTEWIKNKYANEKYFDYEEVLKWDLESQLQLLAGLIDTDGGVSYDKDRKNVLKLTYTSQSPRLVHNLTNLIRYLFSIDPGVFLDNREYPGGPIYSVQIKRRAHIQRILSAVGPYMQIDHKKVYTPCEEKPDVPVYLGKKSKKDTYDLVIDSPTNLYQLANGLITHNSGKTSMGARIVSWLFQDKHPYFTKPKDWNGPLQILVVGRTTKITEEILWARIKEYLPNGTFKESRSGGILQKVEHLETGNTIILFSHHGSNDAREKIQGFTAHFVWLDEMPSSVFLMEELEKRIQRYKGTFLVTFSPKSSNEAIKKKIDAAEEPYSKKYQFHMFDNPVYDEEEKKNILQSMEGLPLAYVNSVLYGDWLTEDSNVYRYDSESMCEDISGQYHPSWRHVISVDPASSSQFGYTLWAENPMNNIWYCVQAEKLEGNYSPDEFVELVEQKAKGTNVIKRISDGHETWFIRAAAKKGFEYEIPFSKNNRKQELIQQSKESLYKGEVKLTPWASVLEEELTSAQWSDKIQGRIVNGSKYHTQDAFQYFVDLKPAPMEGTLSLGYFGDLKKRFYEQKAKKEQQQERLRIKGRRRGYR